MTTIGAAGPLMQASPAEPRFKIPLPREVSDQELSARQLAEWGMTQEEYDAWMAKADHAFDEIDKHLGQSGGGHVRFGSASDAAAEGQRLVSSLGELTGATNRLRQVLGSAMTDDRDYRLFGEEFAAVRRKRLAEGIQSLERGIQGYEAEIGGKFQVQGALTQRDEAGNWQFGAFVLEHQGEGFAARIGSDGQAWVAQADGNFRRAEPGTAAVSTSAPAVGSVDLRA